MSNKTPFEIRADLVALASQHAQNQYYANMEFARKLFDKSLESLKPITNFTSVEEVVKFQQDAMKEFEKLVPVAPTIDEIMKKATEMYSFVTKKD